MALIFLFTIFTSNVSAQIDEHKTDIFFGNGVWNTRTSANNGRRALESLIQLSLSRPNEIEIVKMGYSQQQIATVLGISQPAISLIVKKIC